MTIRLDDLVISAFLVLCRIGSCLMVVPGFSSARVPTRVRLYLAVVLSFLVAPLVDVGATRGRSAVGDLLPQIFGECLTGIAIGLVSRLLIEALEFAGTAISNYIGLSAISGAIDGGEPEPALATLVAAFATMMLMVMDFPQHLVISLVESYTALPPGSILEPEALLSHIAGTLATAFATALQISAPFLVYGIVLNMMFAILGKLVPQVSSYFLSGPFLALGGLALLYLVAGEMIFVLTNVLAVNSLRP